MKFLCVKHIIIIKICYYVVNKLLYIVLEFIYINFKSKEIAMGMIPLTVYDVTLNIIENTMDSEIINNTTALLFNTSGSNLNPAITANYIGESTFKIQTVQESWLTERVNRSLLFS